MTKSAVRMIAVDIDGTLLGADGRVSERKSGGDAGGRAGRGWRWWWRRGDGTAMR